MRRSTAHLYAIGLFLASLIAPFLATPDVLREDALLGLLIATPLVAIASLVPGSTDGRTSSGHADLWVTGLAGLALTGVYWWRASLGIPSFGKGLAFEIARTFVFWLPAVLFACLYRSPGEGWLPSGRGRLLLRMTTAFFGAALGVTVQVATLDAYRERVDARPQDEAVAFLRADVAGPDGARSRSAASALVFRTRFNVEMKVVAVHPDSEALEFHMDVGREAFRTFADRLELVSIEVYGDLSDTVRDRLDEKARMLGEGGVAIHGSHAGFAR